jgi:hypothetical protein
MFITFSACLNVSNVRIQRLHFKGKKVTPWTNTTTIIMTAEMVCPLDSLWHNNTTHSNQSLASSCLLLTFIQTESSSEIKYQQYLPHHPARQQPLSPKPSATHCIVQPIESKTTKTIKS